MDTTMNLSWELSVMEWLQSFMGPFLTQVASILSLFGEEMVILVILGFLYWVYDKKHAQYVGDSLVFGLTLNPLVKNLVLRPRPYMVYDGVKCLKPVDASADVMNIAAQGYSFPSGHSMNAAIIYGSLAQYQNYEKRRPLKWLTVLAFVLPLLVGISRVLVGVHYPTDVLAGWTLGAAIILVMPLLRRLCRKRWILHLLLLVLALPGVFYCKTNDYYTGLGMMIGFFLALPFEEHFVQFKNTRSIPWAILRMLGGFAVYFGLNTLLKLPFPKDFLESPTMAAYLVRTARYIIVVFAMLGVYPLAFKIREKRENFR